MVNKKFLNASKKMIHSVGSLMNSTKNTLETQTHNMLYKYDKVVENVVSKAVNVFNEIVPGESLEIKKDLINKNNSVSDDVNFHKSRNKPN